MTVSLRELTFCSAAISFGCDKHGLCVDWQ